MRAVRAFEETINQPQQSDLRRETFSSSTANLSLQWGNGNLMRALPMEKD
jgi:hypothetical protein